MAEQRTSTRRDHLAVAREAGLGRMSPLSAVAGTLSGYGAFALVAAVAGAALAAADVETDFRTNDWASSGAVGGLATAVVLLASYLFGGYVAGRMARRAGAAHGLAVFVLSLVIGAVVGGLVAALADAGEVERNLRSIGVPTTTDEWTGVGVASAAASLGAILVGAVVGGALGERWHVRLARRAADPAYGPVADAQRRVEAAAADDHGALGRDDLVRRDAAHVDPAPAAVAVAAGTGPRPADRDQPTSSDLTDGAARVERGTDTGPDDEARPATVAERPAARRDAGDDPAGIDLEGGVGAPGDRRR